MNVENLIKIPGRLHSTQYNPNDPSVNHIVSGTDEIYDESANAKQSDINRSVGEALDSKLGIISDLEDIRTGAAAGANAYQKPSDGIPKEDLSSAVQSSLGKADTALQEHLDLTDYTKTSDISNVGFSGSYNDLIDKPTIPEALTFDNIPTTDSDNPVTSNGIKSAINAETNSRQSAIASLRSEVSVKLNSLDLAISTLNGNDVIIVSQLPASGEINKIYRLLGQDSYTDYMWDTNLATPAFSAIATYSFPGIDEQPVANSNNLITSGAIASLNNIAFLRNGSYGNTGNANIVSSSFVQINNANGIKAVRFSTTRPNLDGYRYAWGYALTSSVDDLGKAPNRSETIGYISHADCDREGNESNLIDIWNNRAVGILMLIMEVSIEDPSVKHPLRVEDFDGYEVFVEERTNFDKGLSVQFYVSDNSAPIIEEGYLTESTSVYLLNNSFIFRCLGAPNNYTLSQLATLLDTSIILSPSGKDSIEIKDTYCLVYDTESNALKIKSRDKIWNDVILISCVSGKIVHIDSGLMNRDLIYKINNKSNINSDSLSIRNGSFGNINNTNCITSSFIKVKNQGSSAHIFNLITTRPNLSGYRYAWGYVATNSENDLGKVRSVSDINGYIGHGDYTRENNEQSVITIWSSQLKGICAQIAEVNIEDPTIKNTLSVLDFNGYEVRIEEWEDSNIENGAQFYVANESNQIVEEGYSAGDTNVYLLNNTYIIRCTPTVQNYTLSLLATVLGTQVVKSPSNKDSIAIEDSHCLVYDKRSKTLKIKSRSDVWDDIVLISCVSGKIVHIDSGLLCRELMYRAGSGSSSGSLKIRNGSIGNPGNVFTVTTEVISVSGTSKVGLETNRPNSENCIYTYGWALTRSSDDIGTLERRSDWNNVAAFYDYDSSSSNQWYIDLSNYLSIKGIAFTIAEYNTVTGEWKALRTSDFNNYSIKVVCSKTVEKMLDSSSASGSVSNDVVERNNDKRSILANACRLNKDANGSKDFQALIITDTHGEMLSMKNAVKATNGFDTVDCLIHCGDIGATTYDTTYLTAFFQELENCTKPWFVVVGNHDVGNTMRVHYGATHEEIYNSFVVPMINSNILTAGEYEIGKPYYYHDFATRKIRLIVLYEYQAPLDVADNEYWEEVAYDASKDKMQPGITYEFDPNSATILNCGGYTGGSFRLKKTVTTTSGQYMTDDTMPKYKVGRADRVIMQDQAQWLINTMSNTPDDYGIIIATHNPSMINSTNLINRKFAVNTNHTAKQQGLYSMETDLLSEIVNAYINKSSLSLKVKMNGSYWNGSDASYLNTLNDGLTTYCYMLEADFSDRNNNYFAGYVSGHAHKDLVFKHDQYSNQYCISPICGITEKANNANNDVARPYGQDDQSYDAITVVSVNNGRIALARIGNDRTIDGDLRDYEVINTTE